MKAASWRGLYTWHIAATDQPVYRMFVHIHQSSRYRMWNLSSQTSCMTDIPMKVPSGYVSLIALPSEHIVAVLEADVRI